MLGWELRALRREAGVTSKDLAAKLGLDPSTLSRYEKGHLVVPKTVEYAALYLCRPETNADRLAKALIDVVQSTSQ